jgi:putative acetyltransferase
MLVALVSEYARLVNVRAERDDEWMAVRGVHLTAFGKQGQVVATLADELRAAVTRGEGVSLVACEGDELVGHAMSTAGLLDAPARLVSVQVLSPVGVLPAWQKRGVGSALIREGLRLLTERAVPVVFVEGPPKYYSRFGFAPGKPQGFRKPSLRIADAAFQAIRLPAHEEWMTGTFVYPEVFWRHDAVGLREAS